MSYEPLHHKYRPKTFADLVGQDAITTTLTNAIRTSKIAPAYLFTGPRGTGKTSSARILAKSLNCLGSKVPTEKPCGECEVCKGIANGSALDVIEIDAASNTGVDNIREIIDRAQFAPVQCRYKVYIIDEVHMLSTAAFNALLKTLEEPPDRVVFVLATTDPQRVLPTIISRCQRFDFRRIPLEAMVKHLNLIACQEQINITQEAVQLVAQIAQGGLRDAESLLDQLSLLAGQVTVERVWDLVGSVAEPDLMKLLQAIARNNTEAVLDCARSIMDRGREPLTVLQNLAGFYRDLLIAKTAPSRSDLVAVTPAIWKALCEAAVVWDVPTLLAGQQHLAKSEAQIKNTAQPRLWLEVTLLGLLPSANSVQHSGFGAQGSAASHQSGGDGLTSARVQRSEPQQQPPHPAPLSTPAKHDQVKSPPEQAAISQPPSVHINYPEPRAEPVSIPELRTEVEPIPSVSDPSEVNSPAQTSQEQIWQQVLDNLQPNSTQALLRQMGHLIDFDVTVARIGMKSQALCNKAKVYLPNIKAAFQATFKREVQVSLELATPPQAKTATDNNSPAPAPANSSQSTQPKLSYFPASSSSQRQALTEIQPATSQVSESPMGVAMPTPANATEWEDDEVAIAAQRLADFFKGEVVRLQDQPVFPQPIATQANPEWYDGEPEEEADANF